MVMRMLNKIGAFGMLLFIFVCTMALMGQQSLAHRMRFDTDGYPVPLVAAVGDANAASGWRLSGEAATCTQGCADNGMTCSNSELSAHNNEVASDSLMAGVVSALGFTCTVYDNLYGLGSGVPGIKLDNGQCIVSAMDRESDTFNCDYAANSGKKRLCWCTDAPVAYVIPRTNFDTFGSSVLAVMQLLTGERWERVMFDANRAIGIWGSLYCVTVVVLGQFIVLNIFVAILINSFNTIDSSIDDASQVSSAE
jgi:hypothetical protein